MKPLLTQPALVTSLLLFGIIDSGASTNKALILGIDGCMPSAMAVAHTPNLDLLKSNGCYSVRVVTHPVTHSAACWSSMFTGVWGDKHLVNDPGNSFAGNNFSNYPSFFKRLEQANSNLNTLCFARWSPLITVVPDADVTMAFNSDAEITAETCRQLTNSNPDVLYMILLDVDSAGHSYGWGPTVPNYVSAIETADGRVGQIVQALYSRPDYAAEDWLVIAVTDHGEHDHPEPERSRIIWEIFSGPSAARGVIWPSPSIVDVCATVLTHMGVPIDPAWNLDARVAGLPLPSTRYGTNLILNGDAEAISGTDNYSTNRCIAWWFDLATTTIGTYGSNSDFPSLISPGPPERGAKFFLGGINNSFITQRIEISNIAQDVDVSGVDYTLSGWFGGKSDDDDSASLTATFLDNGSALLGSKRIGDVTAEVRQGITSLLEQTTTGTLPAGTRFVEFALTNQVSSGNNDASADNLSFVIMPKVDLPFRIEVPTVSAERWIIVVPVTCTNRLYSLEHSSDLTSWEPISVPMAGTGAPISLSDTNSPTGPTFYRVSRIRL